MQQGLSFSIIGPVLFMYDVKLSEYPLLQALAAHIRAVHTLSRPYECDMCGKK